MICISGIYIWIYIFLVTTSFENRVIVIKERTVHKPFYIFFLLLIVTSGFASADEKAPAFLSLNMRTQWVWGNEVNNLSANTLGEVDPMIFHGASIGVPIGKMFGGDFYFGVNAIGYYEDNKANGGNDLISCSIGGLWNEILWPIGGGFYGGIHLGYPCGILTADLNDTFYFSGLIWLEPALSLYYRIGSFQFQCMPGWCWTLNDQLNEKLVPNGLQVTLSAGFLI